MLSRRSCQDCGRLLGISTGRRVPRCFKCHLERSSTPVPTRPCLQCGFPIRIKSCYVRCDLCRESLRLSGIPRPPEINSCWQCGNPFYARQGVSRCFRCRSIASRVILPPVIFDTSPTASSNSFMNSFHLPIPQPPLYSLPTTNRSKTTENAKTTENERAYHIICQAINFLHHEYQSRVHASNMFPPEISSSDIRASVASYQNELCAATQKSICCSCGRLVYIADICQLFNEDPLLRILEGYVDQYGRQEAVSNICSLCYACLL
jgi:hypothetical protein